MLIEILCKLVNKMNAKTISFAALMGALGNILFIVSSYIGKIAPGVALDFSLIAAFIAGLYGGPLVGFVTGLLIGISPGIYFGPLGMGGWLGLIGLPFGKGLTGLTAGLLSKGMRIGEKKHSSLLTIPLVFVSYLPECIFTYVYFAFLLPYFIGTGSAEIFLIFILPKALAEITVMSFLMAALVGNYGFSVFVSNFFKKPYLLPKLQVDKTKS